MQLNKTILYLGILLFTNSLFSQVHKKSVSNLNILTLDSTRLNCKWNESFIVLNYQTGETVFNTKAESFNSEDTILRKYFKQKNNAIEIHFNVPLDMIKKMTTGNQEFSGECPGMLYINNHFHDIRINYSFFNKSGTSAYIDKSTIFFSMQCNFNPVDFQLDWLNKSTNEPPLIWLNNQPLNIINVE